MTLAISLKVNDGLVLAADSASTIIVSEPTGNSVPYNVYNNANKIYNLRKGFPIGAITWGAGSIGNSSISTLIKDLRVDLSKEFPDPDKSFTVEEFAQRVRSFLYEGTYLPEFKDWPEGRKPYIGFIVAGYSSGNKFAEEYQIEMQGDQCLGPNKIWNDNQSGIVWRGQIEAISRLLQGFSPDINKVLEHSLGVSPALIDPAVSVLRQELETSLVVPAMPFQDAIDLAEFLLDLTIKYSRFLPGLQTVGGPIEIAAISKHEGFKWIKRKHYFDSHLNPEAQP